VSAQLKSYEGPDVQALVDQIRLELGPGAKIDGAEKIRVGGLLGFFTKEHYRVVVEVPPSDSELSAPMAPSGREPQNSDQRPSRWTRRKGEVAGPAPVPPAPIAEATSGPVSSDAGTGGATERLVDPSEADEPALVVDPPVVFDASASEDDGLSALNNSETGPDPIVDPVAHPDPEFLVGVMSGAATSLQNGTTDSSAIGVVAGNGRTASPGHESTDRPEHDTDGSLGRGMVDPDISSTAQFRAPVRPDPGPVTTDPGPMSPDPTGGSGEPDPTLLTALRRAGFDAATVEALSAGLLQGADLETLLLETFDGLPAVPPLPRRAGSLLAVVGAGTPARRLAASLAAEIGIDPAELPFASLDSGAYSVATGALLVRSAQHAAEHAPGWRRSRAAIVVVDACVTDGPRPWASYLVASLRPTAVWGVVDSTCKTEDIAMWAETIGGVDALALENVEVTVSPAAALGLGIPVARLNGQPATASRWAAFVMARLPPPSDKPEYRP
jgi:hypothetical protein